MPDVSGLSGEEVLNKIINHKSSLERHLAAIRPLIELINEREALHAEKADFEEVVTLHMLLFCYINSIQESLQPK
jgi:hypothetical protein